MAMRAATRCRIPIVTSGGSRISTSPIGFDEAEAFDLSHPKHCRVSIAAGGTGMSPLVPELRVPSGFRRNDSFAAGVGGRAQDFAFERRSK